MVIKRLLSVLFIVVLALPALAITPSAGAQEGPKPEAVGLRPDAPPYALHGPYWVGTREFVVEPESEHPLPVTVWYPALNENGSQDYAVYDLGISDLVPEELNFVTEGQALTAADPALDSAPYPLVIISHGLGGSRFIYFRLSEHLASYGFVVIGIETSVQPSGKEFREQPTSVLRITFSRFIIARPMWSARLPSQTRLQQLMVN